MFNKRHSKFYVSLMILMLMSLVQINAQDFIPGQLWTGLKQPQPQSELPKGKAPFQTSERVAKRNIPTTLVPVQTGEWIISDGWEMIDGKTAMASNKSIFDPQYSTSAWYNATVPGTVLTTLVNQGVYPDPYFGLNNMNIPESLSRTDWWYRCKFTVPKDIDGNQLRLLFNGINYKADIYLNRKSLGDMKGAFIRGEFNITDLVNKNGENILAVHVFLPHNPGIPHEQSMIDRKSVV